MADDQQRLIELETRLNQILQKQEGLTREIHNLQAEIVKLRHPESGIANPYNLPSEQQLKTPEIKNIQPTTPIPAMEPSLVVTSRSFNLEKFIGENIASRVGIIVLVIGVAIGIKYAIDHSVISAGMRLLLGFLGGLGIFGLGLWLKKKYQGFSAVLVSGGLAIMYLMSWAGYSYYHIFSQPVSFVFMTVLTALTVRMALVFNIQFIAHLALVGAYLTPFILSNNEGKVVFLLAYMVIVNIGMLVLAYFRNWRPLQIVTFIFSWLVFAVLTGYKIHNESFLLPGLFFSTMFYSIFYISFIAHHLHTASKISFLEVSFIVCNAFVAYFLGYKILEAYALYKPYSGFFTACHAVPHLLLAVYLGRSKNIDKQLVTLLTGLFMTFVSIAIPVQFDGNWVTLLWISEATLLYFLGNRNQTGFLKNMAYCLYAISFLSLFLDWSFYYIIQSGKVHKSFINIQFFTTLYYTACMFLSALFKRNSTNEGEVSGIDRIFQIWGGIGVLFMGLMFECNSAFQHYFHAHYNGSDIYYAVETSGNYWLLIVLVIYMILLGWGAIQFIKNNIFSKSVFVVSFFMLAFYILSELINLDFLSYLKQPAWPVYTTSMRYLAIFLLAIGVYTHYRILKSISGTKNNLQWMYDLFVTGLILLVGSNETYFQLNYHHLDIPYRLPVSIWWGMVSMGLVVLGIYLQRRYLRITAFVIFGITLLKILIYDSSGMDNGPKTVLYLVIGILLLLVSYLYNRYKQLLFGKDEPSHSSTPV